MALLEIEDLSYSYDSLVKAVADVSFEVPQGTIVGLIGPNGSGKSTLIKNVFDLLRLQAGNVRIDGHRHDHPRARAQGMYLSSNDYLPEFLTAREYIAMMASLYGVDADHAEAEELFRRFAMAERYDHLIEDYSHGMRKKTQLVSALVMRRPLTVIDETLNGIDLEALRLAEAEFARLREEGRSLLLCTHDFAVLERLADRIVLLDFGQVIYDAPAGDLVDEHGSLSELVFDYLESDER
ncbi:ABC transporter ATP-binding protein [Glycomyces salinus]|uniref:ABC transporter ATP-binding protein n=1 Tax=Glycomyces salinus TaxID=980294 RepID=UPI0018ECB74C|nr:ABC transporter ATP-binding protein [Glycomyces salinus]